MVVGVIALDAVDCGVIALDDFSVIALDVYVSGVEIKDVDVLGVDVLGVDIHRVVQGVGL